MSAAVAMSASVAVFLDDLQRSGVTEMVADVPYDWFAEPVKKQPAAPAAQAAPAPAQKAAPVVRLSEVKPAASAQEKDVDIHDWLQLQAEAGSLLFVVPDEGLNANGQPLSQAENDLLCKIIRAAGLENTPIGWLRLQHDAADPAPLAPAVQQKLNAAVVQMMQKVSPCGVVLLGGTAVRSIFGRGVTMDEARTQALALPEQLESIAVQASYHPAALLQEPLLKRDVWQDWLSLVSKLTKGQQV